MFGIRPSLTEKRENCLLPFLFFPSTLGIAQPDFTRRDSAADGKYARRPGLIERLSISLWLKHATSTGTPTSWRTLEKRPYRVTMWLYASSFKNRLFGATRANAFRVGCPNTRFFAHFCN